MPEVDTIIPHQHMSMGQHGQCVQVGGCSSSTLELQRHMLGTSHNPYQDPSSQEGLFDGCGGGGRIKAEEIQNNMVHIEEPSGDACSTSVVQDPSAREALYGMCTVNSNILLKLGHPSN